MSGIAFARTRTAFADVTVEMLPAVLDVLPRAYRVVGSAANEIHGVVRLVVASDLIPFDGGVLRVTVADDNNVRTVTVTHEAAP